MPHILTVVGARPQFVKAAAISRYMRESKSDGHSQTMVHTGQHFDKNMSQVFFDELDIPAPQYNLQIAGGHHGAMTGKMLAAIEEVLLAERPDWVLIYGDTNSTLAGALAAAKLHIPVAHVEAGLRSFNMKMPEEVNRVLADRVSKLLLCPTQTAVTNLANEGMTQGVHNVGDVMYDVALWARERASQSSNILSRVGVEPSGFVLATCHRAENTDDPHRLRSILQALVALNADRPVLLPLHPRTADRIAKSGLEHLVKPLTCLEPLPFLDMVALTQDAALVVTDSGGLQKEAFFFNVPCVTIRDETEWSETVTLGWNKLTGPDQARILAAAGDFLTTRPALPQVQPYGNGDAAERVLSLLS